jgi:hypothetical protein
MKYMAYFDAMRTYSQKEGKAKMDDYIDKKEGFYITTNVISGLLAVVMAADIALSAMSFGAKALSVALDVAAVAAIGVCSYFDGKELVNLKKERDQ